MKKIGNIVLLFSIIIFVPFIKDTFLIPKLFLISIIPLVSLGNFKKISLPSLFLLIFSIIIIIINPSYIGIFCLIQILLFIIIFETSKIDKEALKWIRIGILITAIYAIFQFFGIDFGFWKYDWIGKKVFSTIGNPNSLGIIFMMATLMELFFVEKKNPIFITIFFAALLATLSKGTIAIFIFMVLLSLVKNNTYRKILYYSMIILMVTALFVIHHPKNTRGEIFKLDVKTIKNYPLGIGLGRFPIAYKKTLAIENKDFKYKNTRKIFVKRAHNEFFHFTIEYGFLGAIIFMVFFIAIIEILFKKKTNRILPILGYSAVLFYDFPLHQPISTLLFLMLLSKFIEFKKKIKISKWLALSLCLLPFFVNGYQFIGESGKSYPFYNKASFYFEKAKVFNNENYIKKALNEDIYPAILNFQADLEIEKGNFEKGFQIFDTSKKMVPELLSTRRLIIKDLHRKHDWNRIEMELLELLNYEKHSENYYSLAIAYFNNGKYGEGKALLNKHFIPYESVSAINIMLGNYDMARKYGKYSKREKEIEAIIQYRKGNISMSEKLFKRKFNIKQTDLFSEIDERKTYRLSDLLIPLPLLLKYSDENIFNPTYYLKKALKDDLPNIDVLMVLYAFFPEFKFLSTPFYTVYGFGDGTIYKKENVFHLLDLQFLSNKERTILNYLFKTKKGYSLKDIYTYFKKIDFKYLNSFITLHNDLYHNSFGVLNIDKNQFFLANLNEYFFNLMPIKNAAEKELVYYITRKIADKNWSKGRSQEIYKKLKNKKILTLKEYFLFVFAYYDIFETQFWPDKKISDMDNYPNYKKMW